MGSRKTILVSRQYIIDKVEELTGVRIRPRRIASTLEWLDRNIGTYYTENERMLYGITSRLYRRELVDLALPQMIADDYFHTLTRPEIDAKPTEE